jgi:hypothetical protein
MKIDIGIRNLDVIVDTDDLMPCPCCGSLSEYRREAHDFFGFDVVVLAIECNECPLSMESPDLLESSDIPGDVRALVNAWNTRVTK